MKNTNEKKIDTLKVFKVIVFIYSIVIIALLIQTVYGWATGKFDTDYTVLAASAATYCATAAAYEELKKRKRRRRKRRESVFSRPLLSLQLIILI